MCNYSIIKKILLYGAGLLLASASLLQAQKVEIAPFYGYRFGGEIENATTGEKYGFQDAPAYGLVVGLGAAESATKLELLWSRQDSSLDLHGEGGLNNVNLTIDEFQIGGIAETGKNHLREYVSAHVGATYYSTDSYGSDTKFSLGVGVGVKYYITKNFLLRADLRGFCTVVDSEGGFIYYNGVTVARYTGSTIWQGQASIGASISF
jgi:hypothetical protein